MEILTIKPVHAQEVIRWIARIGSLAGVGMLFSFLSGEEFHPAQLTVPEWISLMLLPTGVTFGLVMAWRSEILGGAIAFASLAGFYAMEGAPGRLAHLGWAWVVLAIPGLLFLLAAILKRRGLE